MRLMSIVQFFDFHLFPTLLTLLLHLHCISPNTCHGRRRGIIICNAHDRDSLTAFNLSISAAASSPLNWSLSVDCCEWEGVGCHSSGRVTTLWLQSRGLTGRIPPSLFNLTSLTNLSLSNNYLTGIIPHDIGRLSILEHLHLHGNNLSGAIPGSLANCTKLKVLILRFNSLQGDLPAFDFSNFVQLRALDLGLNYFTGGVPESLASCKMLRAIRLTDNLLGGEIPPGLPALQNLSLFAIGNCNLSNFRSSFRILSGIKNLRFLSLQQNFFGEELPQEENLIDPDGFPNLQFLTLSGCWFTGTIPPWLSKLTNIGFLALSWNSFTGSIPGWMGSLPNLFLLDLSVNKLSGQFPRELTQLQALSKRPPTENRYRIDDFELPIFAPGSRFSLQYNRLSSFPAGLLLQDNSLSGEIPTEIGQLKFLAALELTNNNFSGNIPPTLGNLRDLFVLNLSGNHLTGQIPESLKNLHFLSGFSVSDNNLEGPIPTGSQFDTFPSWSFEGNPNLCGAIIQKPCVVSPASPNEHGPAGQDGGLEMGNETTMFDWKMCFAVGYAVSFILTVVVVLRSFNL